jgi:glycosyltransferase involved in cell wall biosynthesis
MSAPGAPLRPVDIIVPVYNEEASIDEFIARVTALGLREALIFVDNASTDQTVPRIERHAGVRLLRHQRNTGYGSSIRDGLAMADAAALLIIDADLEYPPEAIPELLAALEHHAVVYGSRFAAGDPVMPWVRRFGNGVLSGVFNVLFQQSTTDLYTGMKAMRREVLASVDLTRNGFEHVAELGVQLAAAGYRIHDVHVTYSARTRGVSKMRHMRETLKYAWYIGASWLRLRILRRS